MVILVISEVIPVILGVIPVIPVIPGNRDTASLDVGAIGRVLGD